ncbi:hypothetical protein ADILRU_1133 [Leifsonia rubra CMS 76R]|nr:hypothetical protein ADILRU_1133 [Leifsonia rubra CMS 76R]
MVKFQSIVSRVTVASPHAQRIVAEIDQSEAGSAEAARITQRAVPARPSELLIDHVNFLYSADNAVDAVSGVAMRITFGSAVALGRSLRCGKVNHD